MKIPYKVLLAILIAVLFALFIITITIGRYDLGISEVFLILASRVFSFLPINQTWAAMSEIIVMQVRLPRVAAAMFIGAALATAGATYQGLFRNPMASPDFLGVTSGAGIGAALAIVLELPFFYVQIFALIGGIIATSMTVSIPKLLRNDSSIVLILSGIIVSGLFRSGMSFMRYIADPQTALPAIVFWQMGSLARVNSFEVIAISVPMLICFAVVMGISWWLNIMSLGEVQSAVIGANYKFYRRIGILTATVLTVLSVAVAGEVGWVGLAIPHLSRLLVGADNKKLMPVCMLTGAIFMLTADTFARSLTTSEIPLGVLTGIIGAPFFIAIIYKQKSMLS
ncbi:MAG: iron ABC transporter permease [Defluviitaleaceae bacterium]|nr:iron ABC transporter permease [Defluviitaleaceae bacterium]